MRNMFLAVLVCAPAVAFAQADGRTVDDPNQPVLVNPHDTDDTQQVQITEQQTTLSNDAMTGDSRLDSEADKEAVLLGVDAGALDYSSTATPINPGGALMGRLTFAPESIVGVEIAGGVARNEAENAIGAADQFNSYMLGGNLRVNVPGLNNTPVRPYAFGGGSYLRVDAGSDLALVQASNLFAVPVGAGIDLDVFDHFTVGARGQYGFLFNDESTFAGDGAGLWSATVNVGGKL